MQLARLSRRVSGSDLHLVRSSTSLVLNSHQMIPALGFKAATLLIHSGILPQLLIHGNTY